MELGDAGRKAIKGHDLDYYLNLLHETREHSLAEFRKPDDAWLQSGPTEQFCRDPGEHSLEVVPRVRA